MGYKIDSKPSLKYGFIELGSRLLFVAITAVFIGLVVGFLYLLESFAPWLVYGLLAIVILAIILNVLWTIINFLFIDPFAYLWRGKRKEGELHDVNH